MEKLRKRIDILSADENDPGLRAPCSLEWRAKNKCAKNGHFIAGWATFESLFGLTLMDFTG